MTTIRAMMASDVPAATALLAQLGYALDGAEVARRLRAVAGTEGHAALVAEQGGRVAGLCHVFARPALEKPPEAVVQSLVVDHAARGRGVGAALMRAAEEWARARGYASVSLASGVARADAHAFYEAIGYRRTATSLGFRKQLDGGA